MWSPAHIVNIGRFPNTKPLIAGKTNKSKIRDQKKCLQSLCLQLTIQTGLKDRPTQNSYSSSGELSFRSHFLTWSTFRISKQLRKAHSSQRLDQNNMFSPGVAALSLWHCLLSTWSHSFLLPFFPLPAAWYTMADAHFKILEHWHTQSIWTKSVASQRWHWPCILLLSWNSSSSLSTEPGSVQNDAMFSSKYQLRFSSTTLNIRKKSTSTSWRLWEVPVSIPRVKEKVNDYPSMQKSKHWF